MYKHQLKQVQPSQVLLQDMQLLGAFVGWLAGLDPMTVLGVCIGLGGLLVSFQVS